MEWRPDDEYTDEQWHLGYQEPREPKKRDLLFWFFLLMFIVFMLIICSNLYIR